MKKLLGLICILFFIGIGTTYSQVTLMSSVNENTWSNSEVRENSKIYVKADESLKSDAYKSYQPYISSECGESSGMSYGLAGALEAVSAYINCVAEKQSILLDWESFNFVECDAGYPLGCCRFYWSRMTLPIGVGYCSAVYPPQPGGGGQP